MKLEEKYFIACSLWALSVLPALVHPVGLLLFLIATIYWIYVAYRYIND